MLRGAYGYGTCLSKLVSHPFFTNHTYGTQEEDMALLTLDNVQNVSIEAALRHLTLAEKAS